jgi:hypothetical protein
VKSLASPVLVILLSGLTLRAATPNTAGEFWPEVDTYINLNSTTRLLLVSTFRDNQPGDAWHGDFGTHLNFALKPVFRVSFVSGMTSLTKDFFPSRQVISTSAALGAGRRISNTAGLSTAHPDIHWLGM